MTSSSPRDPAPAPSGPSGLNRIDLFGLPFVDAPSLEPVMAEILAGEPGPEGLRPLVLTPNVDIVVHLDRNPTSVESTMFRSARYCLPDGQPIVAASRLLRRPLGARLAGSDLFTQLWPRLVTEQVPVVVVASSSTAAELLADDDPLAEFVVPPMFSADDPEAIDAVVEEVLAAARRIRPAILLVGIGNPKDARLIAAIHERWDPTIGDLPLSMGLGASFLLHLGLQRRAPQWIQRLGMEWFHRFLQEPRRLFRRYFINDVAFLPIVFREWRRKGSGPRRPQQ
jgi:N-acetylglucosaminyldiphosphoundecaprenol N-acetyl-beta-D-mannosaminyltransferase